MKSPLLTERDRPGRLAGWILAILILSLLAQAGMAVLGGFYAASADRIPGSLILWCALGTLYLAGALVLLGVLSRQRTGGVPIRRPAIIVNGWSRAVTAVMMAMTAVVGLGAAVQVLWSELAFGQSNPADESEMLILDVIGVWAMLLAWGFLHWGYAQLYYQRYYAAAEPPLRFPNTPDPRIVDFVYYAFCIAVSFAVSDVETQGQRIRHLIVWHSVLGYFFNALIIVLAINTILGTR